MIIYQITNTINRKIYVGQTVETLRRRWLRHRRSALNGTKGCTYLHRAIRRYGPSCFIQEVLEVCVSRDHLNSREIYWIKVLRSRRPSIGYNISAGGHETKLSPEGRAQLSRKLRGRKDSPETKRRKSVALMGNKNNLGRGHIPSEETRKKTSVSMKGKIPWNKGLRLGPLPESVKRKLSESHKGQKPWCKGRSFSEEHRRRLSESRRKLGQLRMQS